MSDRMIRTVVFSLGLGLEFFFFSSKVWSKLRFNYDIYLGC